VAHQGGAGVPWHLDDGGHRLPCLAFTEAAAVEKRQRCFDTDASTLHFNDY
jgi:hypothetical protein